MRNPKRKGFTLIELLVVIAIIGILASIVLVSFPSATKKAKDSRIIGAIAQARTVMTYICENDGNCDAFTCNHLEMGALCKEIDNNYGTDAKNDKVPEPIIVKAPATGNSSSTCIYSPLNSGDYYCADRTGVAGVTTSTCPATAICPAFSD